jgi:hypothetical protein
MALWPRRSRIFREEIDMRKRVYGQIALLIALGSLVPVARAAGQEKGEKARTAAGEVAPTRALARGNIALFDRANFRGGRMNFTGPVTNLSALRPRTRSASVATGAWELCSGPRFTGRCVTLTRSTALLGGPVTGFRVRSLRPLPRQTR